MGDKAVLMTGPAGFIGKNILAHYLQQNCDLYLVETAKVCPRLQAHIDAAVPDLARRARIKVIAGDIKLPYMGLDAPLRGEIKDRVTHAIHLAALYDLAIPRSIAMQVNVEGTRHVMEFIATFKNFQRLAYASTVAISGAYTGLYTEKDFDKGQAFKNFYEETKFLAEKEVRGAWKDIPVFIFRPTIIVGHSKTGVIEKIDGPYYSLVMIRRGMNRIGPNAGAKCHIAPVDYVADGVRALLDQCGKPGTVYCLGDPNPITYNEFFDLVCTRWGKGKVLLRVPPALMSPMMRIPLMQKACGVPFEAFQYADLRVEYGTNNATAALVPLGISCPPLTSYIDVMIRYFDQHYNDPAIRRGVKGLL